MNIAISVLILLILWCIYLIVVDLRLRRRVRKLEKVTRKLEGLKEDELIKEDRTDHEDYT